MIRNIEEYKEELIKTEAYEYTGKIVKSWFNPSNIEKIKEKHNKFLEDVENDLWLNEMYNNRYKMMLP